MRKILAAIMLCLMAVIPACSAFRSPTQMINVTCSEPDTILTINGQRCTSPAQVNVKRNRDVSIQAYKEGFVPYQRTIGHHFNGTGALDAAGAVLFLLPGVGLFCPGAWSLDETDLFITIYEKQGSNSLMPTNQ